jgi:protoporphyrinogen oxidase
MKNENIAIIGAGLTGLTAAYRLSKKGHKVTVLEKSQDIGGLMGGFEINGTSLEKAYHHIFKTDTDIIDLVKELRIEDKLEWHESSIGLYYEGKLYPFVTPLELLRFGGLDLISKIRMGVVALYLQKTNNWKKFVEIPAAEWMEKYCGKNAYKVIWEPLLKGKFHEYYDKVSMAWLWARIHTRGNSKEKGEVKEKLGYFKDGFRVISDALEFEIKKNGGRILTNINTDSIRETKNGKVKLTIDGQAKEFDKVIAAVPSHVLGKLIDSKKHEKYITKLNSIDYLGALVVIFSTPQSLSKYYWHNINDLESPFLALIQHTNLINKANYKNENVYYLGTYLPQTHKYFGAPEKEIYKDFFTYLKKIFPKFDEKKITSKFVFKLGNAQHVVDTSYFQKIPEYKTPIKNLYLANFSQIFPEDRGTNFAVREGNKISKLVLKQNS